MTMSPTTNGELAKPHVGVFMAASDAASRDHTTAPLLASSAFTIPVAPNVYTRPLLRVGVPRGPGPPFDSQNRAVSRCAISPPRYRCLGCADHSLSVPTGRLDRNFA